MSVIVGELVVLLIGEMFSECVGWRDYLWV